MKWYSKSYRRSLIDMHIEDWNDEFLSEFSPKNYVEQLKKANFQSATIYMNSHVGYCYWPSTSAASHMHRCLHGEDKMGELIKLCHGAGIDVIAYYTLIFNNWAYENHPEWRMVDRNGETSRVRKVGGKTGRDLGAGGRYGLVCPNNNDHRAFVAGEIAEFSHCYEFEGLFLDMTFWPFVCYCPSCRDRYRKETGKEIPRVLNWSDAAWREFQSHRENWITEFGFFATAEAKRHKPEVSVEHNFATATFPWDKAVTEKVSEASDYVGGDLYGGFKEQSFVCKLYHGISRNFPFEYMTSRCYPNLREHTTIKPKQMIELHAYLTLAHHGAFMIIDAMDPNGTLNPKLYDLLADLFRSTQKYEPYMTGTLRQDVGVYFSMRSKMDPQSDEIEPSPEDRFPHLSAALGAANALREAHIAFGVLTSQKLADLKNLKALVLPEVLVMENQEIEAIKEWIREGGNAYIGGRTSPELLQEVLGLDLEGMTDEELTYTSLTDEGASLLHESAHGYPLSIQGRQTLAKVTRGQTKVLATITLPYTDPADTQRFASIHSNPPGRETTHPAIVSGGYGKGKVVWASTPIEAMQRETHRRVFTEIMRSLCGNDLSFEVDAPHVAEVVMFDDPEQHRYLLSLVNVQDEMPLLPLYDLSIAVKVGPAKAKGVTLLPAREKVAHRVSDGKVHFHVERLDLFKMFEVTYEK